MNLNFLWDKEGEVLFVLTDRSQTVLSKLTKSTGRPYINVIFNFFVSSFFSIPNLHLPTHYEFQNGKVFNCHPKKAGSPGIEPGTPGAPIPRTPMPSHTCDAARPAFSYVYRPCVDDVVGLFLLFCCMVLYGVVLLGLIISGQFFLTETYTCNTSSLIVHQW